MSSTPWSIQRTKRKHPANESPPRKRIRISDDVVAKKTSRTKPRAQKTLTQIQWVNNPSSTSEDDRSLRAVGSEREERARTMRSKARKLKKDSTLTQMDWLGDMQAHDDSSMEIIEALPEEVEEEPWIIPSLDGMHEKSRNKKKPSTAPPRTSGSSSPTSIERETQDYRPSKKQKNQPEAPSASGTRRRRSRRIASRDLSHPAKNFQTPNKASLANGNNAAKLDVHARPGPLEVQDSYEDEDELTPIQTRVVQQTPQRRREVPSSQTPESVIRTQRTKRQTTDLSPSKPMSRNPLQERSANLPSKTYSQGIKASKDMLRNSNASPKRSKICTLKVPSRALLQRSGRTENLHGDIYSIQATSSVSERSSSSTTPKHLATVRPLRAVQAEEPIEIPPSSSVGSSSKSSVPSSPPSMDADTEGSLPEISDIIPLQKHKSTKEKRGTSKHGDLHHQASGEDSVMVHDFGRVESQNAKDNPIAQTESRVTDENDVMLLDNDMMDVHHIAPTSAACANPAVEVDDFDLGAPVTNDTQFNVDLSERLSSPDTTTNNRNAREIQTAGPVPGPESPTIFDSNQSHGTNQTTKEIDLSIETYMPTPKLIQHKSSASDYLAAIASSTRNDFTQLPAILHDPEFRATTTLPLNDTAQALSSSPRLPSTSLVANQNIHPASIPHPSQMSTQEPTQNFLMSSMAPQTQRQNQTEPITIKDSSSVHLSQIPQHKSQSQGLDLNLIDDSDDDMDDLDLDPSSTTQGRQSARKPFPLLRKETISSLKSIHPLSSDGSEEQEAQDAHSSPHDQFFESRNASKKHDPSTAQSRTDKPGQMGTKMDTCDSDATSSPVSSPSLPPLKRKYDPLPGFDNETQSNFTQNGHITAAYVHRQRETGAWPDWFTPEPFQIPNWKGGKKRKRAE